MCGYRVYQTYRDAARKTIVYCVMLRRIIYSTGHAQTSHLIVRDSLPFPVAAVRRAGFGPVHSTIC